MCLSETGRTRSGNSGKRRSSSRIALLAVALCLAFGTAAGHADDQVRQVQEELRKRNLFFGDVDGNATPELVSAIKKYQQRKGFAVTGVIDQETAASLSVALNTTASASRTNWPNVPVLKSDTARLALQRRNEADTTDPDPSPSPPPPAESPPAVENIPPERINQFVEHYLRDAEGQDIDAQVRYYFFPVEYFDHGTVDETFVTRDTRNYCNRWPERKYMLNGAPRVYAAGREGEIAVDFIIAFSVRNRAHAASGKTRNFWTLRPQGDDFKIVAIREQRVRD